MKSAAEFKKGKDGTEGLRSDPPGHRQHGPAASGDERQIPMARPRK